jgi:ribonuclease VapC
MIVDSSALIAIVRREQEADNLIEVIGRARSRRISAANYLEAAIVIDKERNVLARRRFDEFIDSDILHIEPVTVEQAEIARAAYRDFGKGSGHAAQLNFGDCFAYALATSAREPLLYQGNDFGLTDLRPAVAPEA